MSSTVARPMLRQSGAWSRMAARRFESTTSTKATEAAKDTMSKATAGLSKVSSSAGPAIANAANAAKGVATSLSKVGGPVGKIVSMIEKQTPTVVYYSKVGAEVAKIVFRGQKMSPPSVATMQSYWQGVLKSVQNPSAFLATTSKTAQQSASFLQQARNINAATLAAGGVVAAECLGFFTVGEMIGRFKIVGYHGAVHAEHH